jgi:hypothetical protein
MSKSSQAARRQRQRATATAVAVAAAPIKAALRALDAEIAERDATARFARDAAWHDPSAYRGMRMSESKMVRRGAETEAEFLSRCMERERVGESSERLRKRIGSVIIARDSDLSERTCRHDGRSGKISGRDTSRYTPNNAPAHTPAGGHEGVKRRQTPVIGG